MTPTLKVQAIEGWATLVSTILTGSSRSKYSDAYMHMATEYFKVHDTLNHTTQPPNTGA